MSNHPKRGLPVTHCLPNLEISYRLRYTQISNQYVPAPESPPHTGVLIRTLSAPLSAAAPLILRGVSKGEKPQFRPFVSFQGGAGGNRNPPAFLFRGLGGHTLFKREYPLGFSVPKRYSSAGNPGNLFGKTKRKWGFNPVRHRRTSSHQSGAFDISKEK